MIIKIVDKIFTMRSLFFIKQFIFSFVVLNTWITSSNSLSSLARLPVIAFFSSIYFFFSFLTSLILRSFYEIIYYYFVIIIEKIQTSAFVASSTSCISFAASMLSRASLSRFCNFTNASCSFLASILKRL